MDGLDYLRDNEYSYRYARIGENYDDYEEKNIDGDNDGYLEYPQLERYFDDDSFDLTNNVDKDVEI